MVLIAPKDLYMGYLLYYIFFWSILG